MMHAYLLIGKDLENLDKEAVNLSQKLDASLMEFPLLKIEDVRQLSRVTSLSLSRREAIYIKGIDGATTEAQNAFLKRLEEPQENLFYILSAASVAKVLPTIVSRCQIIFVKNPRRQLSPEADNFLKLNLGEKLIFVEGIKKRENAESFLEEVIENWHLTLIKGDSNFAQKAQNLKRALGALSSIKRNGNVLLQLTNFVISLE